MNNVNNFEDFLNENFDSAYNTNVLKGIKFKLGSWDSVDKMFKDGDEFQIAFNDKADNEKINDDILKANKKEKSVEAMDISWTMSEFSDAIISVKDGNYAGLTHLFAALDKHYGKYGSSLGWN